MAENDVRPLKSLSQDALVVERYRYILDQKRALNDRSFNILALFQALSTTIVGAVITIGFSWQKLEIEAGTARASVIALLAIHFLIAAYALMSLISGVVTWLDYKLEENRLLNDGVAGPNARMSHPWTWFETYMIIFVLLVTAIFYVFAIGFILKKMG